MSKTPYAVYTVGTFHVEIAVFKKEKHRVREMSKRIGEPAIEARSASYGTACMDIDTSGRAWFSMTITDEAKEGTIVHECVHMADFIMDHLGVPTGVENTEVRAYLTADIYDGVKEALEAV